MNHLLGYINDRYPIFQDVSVGAFEYKMWLNTNGFVMEERDYGFITYRFEGDACILQDLYVAKEFRDSGKAWELFNWLKAKAQQVSGCNVIITFSESLGINQHQGLGAIKAAGFVPHIEEQDRTIFIRGTH